MQNKLKRNCVGHGREILHCGLAIFESVNMIRGEEYVSLRKKTVPARKIQTNKDCVEKCIYKCSSKISEEQRKRIFSDYYSLNAQEKRMYILNTTYRHCPARRRETHYENNSRRSNTYKYYFILNDS